MDLKTCPSCGARWVNGQLFWATGKQGRNIDLAALVCNRLEGEKAENCVNPCRGQDGGLGWEGREKMLESAILEFHSRLDG